jgi:acyl CoA:acetate/3-ketoacid CoA transferase alpha subunit
MAGAAKITIAEVEEPMSAALDPNQIHIPGIMVQKRILKERSLKGELSNVQRKRN